MQEAAQPWEPPFVPREIVPETARCLLSRKPMRLNYNVGQQQHFLPVFSSGAHTDVMSGGIKAAASIQTADEEGQERVDG